MPQLVPLIYNIVSQIGVTPIAPAATTSGTGQPQVGATSSLQDYVSQYLRNSGGQATGGLGGTDEGAVLRALIGRR